MESVAAFTDTYLPTVNGVSYTIAAWRERWIEDGGRMDVVYPAATGYDSGEGETSVYSLPFPFYDGYRLGLPWVPRTVRDVDLVHVHTPFTIGLAGLRLARSEGLPVVASYHTPTAEYTDYIAPTPTIADGLRRVNQCWERLFLERADVVLAPSEATREHVEDRIGLSSPVTVLSNGVDIERFRPVDPSGFKERHDLDTGKSLVGYTGRHGHEKRLDELVDAAADLDVTVVFGGDGPARASLERRAAERGVDARFLGFLDREELPAFYSALDVFAFPSPVETQGIVALEAMVCGTPVVGADSGALVETVDDESTGYRFESGDIGEFRDAITRALREGERLRQACLSRRESVSLERTVDRLREIYASV